MRNLYSNISFIVLNISYLNIHFFIFLLKTVISSKCIGVNKIDKNPGVDNTRKKSIQMVITKAQDLKIKIIS